MKTCYVCGKEKKPYTIIMKNNILSFIKYNQAREDGEICERCNQYFAMTGDLKEATEQEFENAEKAVWFAKMMLKWWEKDKKLLVIDDKDNLSSIEINVTKHWEGTEIIAHWCRTILNSGGKNEQ
jgi:hypothetical protein